MSDIVIIQKHHSVKIAAAPAESPDSIALREAYEKSVANDPGRVNTDLTLDQLKARTAELDQLEASMPKSESRFTRISGGGYRYVAGPGDENTVGDLTDVVPFANDEETADAMRDPRYKRDENYRLSVTRRIAARIAKGR